MYCGKFLIDKPINFEALKKTMSHARNLKDNPKESCSGGVGASFKYYLLFKKSWRKCNRRMSLIFIFYWVRIYNQPFGYRSNNKIKSIVWNMGDIIEIEDDEYDVEPYQRVRVMLDVTKPLKCF